MKIDKDTYTNYDLDYLRFQIDRNCSILDSTIAKLKSVTKSSANIETRKAS